MLKNTNAYELFNLEKKLLILDDDYEKKYKDLLKKTHPDNYYDNFMQESAKNFSILINKKYEIIKNKKLRLKELMLYCGFKQEDIENATINNQEILIKALEIKSSNSFNEDLSKILNDFDQLIEFGSKEDILKAYQFLCFLL